MSKDERKETREQKRQRQTDEIHAALGRYVEAFEQIVMWIRGGCMLLTSLCAQPPRNVQQQRLMSVVFHHRSMTADTLFRIFRALVGEIINDKDTRIDLEERLAAEGVLKQFDSDFQVAISQRNDYLHGTWFIGYGNETLEDWSEIRFSRGKATNDGVRFVDGPKSATDIDALTQECKRLADFFLRAQGCILMTLHGRPSIADNFTLSGTKDAKKWVVKRPAT